MNRPRTQAHIDADNRYKQTVKRVQLSFKEDSELLAWLRSQVSTDAEIPLLIKQIIEDRQARSQPHYPLPPQTAT